MRESQADELLALARSIDKRLATIQVLIWAGDRPPMVGVDPRERNEALRVMPGPIQYVTEGIAGRRYEPSAGGAMRPSDPPVEDTGAMGVE